MRRGSSRLEPRRALLRICQCPLLALGAAAGARAAEPQEAPTAPTAPPDSKSPAARSEEPDAKPAPDLFGIPVHGSFSVRYRFRHASGETDQDAYGLVDLEIGDAEKQKITGHVVARGAADLDGNTDNNGAYVFDSIEDTYDSRVDGMLYEAYADWHGDGSVEDVRLGRQLVWETPVSTYFDGLRVDSKALGSLALKVGAYGGVPSHLYESSPQGDLILGAWGEARPWQSGRARLDWMQVEDDYLFESSQNAMVRLALWQQVGESLALFGNYTMLDWRGRDFELRGTWTQVESDFTCQVDFFQLLTTQKAEALEFDPFFDVAGEYHPYLELRASATKGLGDHFDLTAGADVRRLVDDADEGEFNREFERWYVEPALIDAPIDGMTITVTGELWDANDEKITTGGADVSQELTKDTRARVGTVYSLYKYDYYSSSEKDHVRTYYVGIDSKYTKQLRLRLFYQYEIDAFSNYHTVQAAATWTF